MIELGTYVRFYDGPALKDGRVYSRTYEQNPRYRIEVEGEEGFISTDCTKIISHSSNPVLLKNG